LARKSGDIRPDRDFDTGKCSICQAGEVSPSSRGSISSAERCFRALRVGVGIGIEIDVSLEPCGCIGLHRNKGEERNGKGGGSISGGSFVE